MFDYYPQKSVAELLTILDSVQKRSSTGVLSMTTAGGVQNMRSWQGAGSTELEIRRILYSLYKRDPVTYQNPFKDRVRTTRTSYV